MQARSPLRLLPRIVALALLLVTGALLRAADFVPFSFEVPASPTEPLAREITALVKHPDGRILRLPAFPEEQENRFTVRAMAALKGEYSLTAVLETTPTGEHPLKAKALTPGTVEVKSPAARAMITIDPAHPNRFATSAGAAFYPLGMNLAWPTGDRLPFYRNSFTAFQQNGLNWTRIWFANWGGLNLDWIPEDMGPRSPAPGKIDARVAQLWDAIVDDASAKGVYIQMVFQHHGQYSDKVDSNWAYNPWNAAVEGGFLKTPSDFFTSERARTLTKQKYRYIVARWGYSSAVMAWELFNEVYQVDSYLKGDIRSVAAWHNEMADHLRAIDPYKHLITTSLNDIRSPIWDRMDYLQPHLYAANVIDSVRCFHPSLDGITRPIFYGEVGDDAVLLPRPLLDSGAPIIRSMWSSLVGDSEYAAQPWYPERLLTPARLADLAALSRFITENKLASRAGLRAFQPGMRSDSKVSLVIPAGQWWSRRPAAYVDMPEDGSIPPSLTLVPRAFVGSPDAIADGYAGKATIRAKFPKLTTARLVMNDVGGYGAKLRIAIDGTPVVETTWAECMKGQSGRPQQGSTFAFVVQPGVHEISVENPGGPDWFDLHSIDLGIEVPALAAAGRRGSDFVMLWVWHREGLFAAKQPAAGTILIDDLAAGTWTVTWWDTTKGKPGKPSTLTHKGGKLELPTPDIASDAAVILEKR